MSKGYSTVEVARMAGVDKQTLLRWLWAGKIPEPKHFENGGQKIRLWTDSDVKKVRRYKEANYRKGRGRKKSP
jgi:predicted site-specific integrase-resolvase